MAQKNYFPDDLGFPRRIRRFAACVIALAAIPTMAIAQVAVGPSGSPSYAYAVQVPPGVAGMEPRLALAYTAGSANGPIGYGWTIQGLMMISRCPSTVAMDGRRGQVGFTKDDKLCLNGERLIQTDEGGDPEASTNSVGIAVKTQENDALGLEAGTYREFRTERDQFARIRAYGSVGATVNNGPAYFRVWTKDGNIMDFGAPPCVTTACIAVDANAQVTARNKTAVANWLIARSRDVVGNYIDYKYNILSPISGSQGQDISDGTEWRISEIQYSGNETQNTPPSNRVVFQYLDRTRVRDKSEAFQYGSKNVSTSLLVAVDTYVGGVASIKVATFKLAYKQGLNTARSLLDSITRCTGSAVSKCMPPVRFEYSAGSSMNLMENMAFSQSSGLVTYPLLRADKSMGVVPVDFDGDGKTDLLRWSSNPAENELWQSVGDGTFKKSTSFNISSDVLFSDPQTGCFRSVFADFNGDGLVDILRVATLYQGDGSSFTACPTPRVNKLFLSRGDGAYTEIQLQASIALDKKTAVLTRVGRNDGAYYYVADFQGTGRSVIVSTILPQAYGVGPRLPSDDSLCAGQVCTRVYALNSSNQFVEIPTNVVNRSLYRSPADDKVAVNGRSALADHDGDGVPDIVGKAGIWRARPIAASNQLNFELASNSSSGDLVCREMLDYNGDGRADCLTPNSTAAQNSLTVGTGAAGVKLSSSNLTTIPLQDTSTGYELLDLDGDGRTDILWWRESPAQVALYLSFGDGNFYADPAFGLPAAPPRKADGSVDFILGDFLGQGRQQMLRLVASPTAANVGAGNHLFSYFVPRSTDPGANPDLLTAVVSETGLRSDVQYGLLAAMLNNGYKSDRPDTTRAAVYPMVDLTPASPVVTAIVAQTGVDATATVTSEYAYEGLKAALDGRGALGFRRVAQQKAAADGSPMTTWTNYLLDRPYEGMASYTETRLGGWRNPNAPLLSSASYVYCDRTAVGGATASASEAQPCPTSKKVTRPYLLRSLEKGFDLNGRALPEVGTENTFNNDFGDLYSTMVTTTGVTEGSTQTLTKTTTNTFCVPDSAGCPNKIAGDNWILGRLMRSEVKGTSTQLALSTVAGTAPSAAAVKGVPPQGAALPFDPAVLSAILQLILED